MAFYKVNHNPLAFTFGILGNIISFLMYLAPVPTFYQIYKDKSTGEFKSLPYLVGLFSSMLWLYYGLLKPDAAALVTINSFGCIVELVYNIMFITYATPDAKKSTIRLFVGMNMACFSMIFLFTQLGLREPVLRVQFLGWVSVFVSVSVFAAPLSIATEVIRTKSVQFMPISLSFFLTLSAVVWFFYGFFLKDKRIAVPNVIGFILGIFQMVLYGVYRKYDAKKEDVKEQQELEIVVGQEEEKKKEAQ